jgi:ABC-type transporter Mla subunit MlaD
MSEELEVIETEVVEPKKHYKEVPKESSCISNFLKIVSIPTLLLLTVVLAYIGIIPINMEIHSVIIIGTIYVIFWFFIKHNACYAICSFENKKKVLLEEVSVYIDSNLIHLMGQDKAIGSIDKFFSKFSKQLRNNNFAAVAASTFPTLGILGTFISIAISMPDFGVGSTDALNNEITKLLGGVGTAFYASIYGIFLSLWWVFFEKKGFSYIQKEIRETKEMFEERLWSDEEIQRASFVEQQALNSDLQNTIKQSMSPEFIRNMNDTIREQSAMLLEILKEDKALHEELRDTYRTVLEKFTEITDKQDSVSGKLDQSIESANQSYSNLADNVSKLESLSKVFQSNYDAMTAQNESSKEIAEVLGNVASSLSKDTQEIIKSFESISNNLSATQNTMGTMSSKLLDMSKGMQDILDGLNDTYKSTIEKQMESIRTTVISLENLYSKFHDNIDNTLQSFEISAANIQDGGEKMVESIKNLNLQTISESISVMSKSLHSLEGSMQTTSNSLDQSVTKFDEQFIEKLRYTFKVLDEEIGKVLSKVGAATKTLVDTSGNIEENLEDFNQELLEKLDMVLSVIPQRKEDS